MGVEGLEPPSAGFFLSASALIRLEPAMIAATLYPRLSWVVLTWVLALI